MEIHYLTDILRFYFKPEELKVYKLNNQYVNSIQLTL